MLGRAEAVQRRHGALGALRITLAGLTTGEVWAGRQADAEARYFEAAEISASIGVPPPATTGVLLELRAWQGREQESRALAEMTAEWGWQRGAAVLVVFALIGLTVLEMGLGRYPAALGWGAGVYDDEKGCVFIESLAPSFVKSGENPNGVDQATIDTVRRAILDDRPAWLTGLLADFLNLDDLLGTRVSEGTVHNNWNAGAAASPWATWACVLTWLEDFHEDIERIDVPALILHGTADRILSVQGQGRRMHAALPAAHYVEIEGGPHVMCVTHATEVNRELLAFLRSGVPAGGSA